MVRPAAHAVYRALVKLKADRPGHMFLALVDQRLKHVPLRAEPVAIVDQLRIARHQLILQMRRAAVEGDRFNAPVAFQHDRAAGRFIDAARLHADIAPFDEVQPPDAMFAAKLIQRGQHPGGGKRLSVQRDRIALLIADLDIFRRIGRVFRVDGALIDIIRRHLRRVFQHLAFGGGVKEVRVDREWRLTALILRHRHLMRLGILDQPCAGGQIPFPPRRDHLDFRVQRIGGQLEPHLIVALARRAMGDGVGAGFLRDLDKAFGDQRAGDRGAEEVEPLVNRVRAEHRENEVADELLAHVFDIDVFFLDPEKQRLVARRAQFLPLTEIGGEGHDLTAIFGLKPFQDDRGVEAAGIGKDDFLGRGHWGASDWNRGAFIARGGGLQCGEASGGGVGIGPPE